MSSQKATIHVTRLPPGRAGTARPGTTPWRTLPSNTTKRLVEGGTSQPRVASALSVTRWCVINVGPPTPCGRWHAEQQSHRSSHAAKQRSYSSRHIAAVARVTCER